MRSDVRVVRFPTLMTPKPIPHRVIRTKNKHSRAIYQGDTIIIRLAGDLSQKEEKDHIESLLKRMGKIVAKERRKIVIDPFRPLLEGNQSLTLRLTSGKRYTFTLTPGKGTSARRTKTGWNITVSPQVRRRSLHRLLWKLLAEAELPRLEALTFRMNRTEKLRVSIREVRLQFASTQWGSCSSRGIIMLNAALLFVPPSITKYIIIHELCHRIVPNHSPQYWKHVERAMPHYKEVYARLQEFRLPQL